MFLFTYGTLRKGGGLNYKLDEVAQYVGTFRTYPKYTLYDVGCPCLSKFGDTSVTGDVFAVEDLGQIAHIHNMEVRAGYTLELVELIGFSNPVFAYFQSPDPTWQSPIIYGGDWISYKRGSSFYEAEDRTGRQGRFNR